MRNNMDGSGELGIGNWDFGLRISDLVGDGKEIDE
jgi:hypothetical protein